MVEHSTENAGVDSSILSLGTLQALLLYRSRRIWLLIQHVVERSSCGSSSVVERVLAKDEVEGSNPFSRSNSPIRTNRMTLSETRPTSFRFLYSVDTAPLGHIYRSLNNAVAIFSAYLVEGADRPPRSCHPKNWQ